MRYNQEAVMDAGVGVDVDVAALQLEYLKTRPYKELDNDPGKEMSRWRRLEVGQ
jgi:hypothetical protein